MRGDREPSSRWRRPTRCASCGRPRAPASSSRAPSCRAWIQRSLMGRDGSDARMAIVITARSLLSYAMSVMGATGQPFYIGLREWRDIYVDGLRTITRVQLPFLVVRNEEVRRDPTTVLDRLATGPSAQNRTRYAGAGSPQRWSRGSTGCTCICNPVPPAEGRSIAWLACDVELARSVARKHRMASASRWQVWRRVGDLSVDSDLVVQVGPGRVAGRPFESDLRSTADGLAGGDTDDGKVGVAAGELDGDLEADVVAALVGCLDAGDGAVARGKNGAAPAVVGPVASDATVSRTITGLAVDADRVLAAIAKARATVRTRVWKAAGRYAPNVGGTVTVDLDATLVTAHLDKEGATATFKMGFRSPSAVRLRRPRRRRHR